MIGPRSAVTALFALVLVAVVLGARTSNPEVARNADQHVLERAAEADLALADLQDALAEALETGRAGAAAVVAGTLAPGIDLAAASAMLEAAVPLADDAAVAVAKLEAARRASAPESAPLPAGTDGDELGSIALQLNGVVDPADAFAEMRRRAAHVPVALDAALAAVRDRDFDLADIHLADARADQRAGAAWEVDAATLPVWIEATDHSITIVEDLIATLREGDVAAAELAAAEIASFVDEAANADRALQIAISESGGTIAAAPLARLAAVVRTVDEQRAAVGDVLAAGRSDGR